jgi:uncharacterized protein YcfJ
MSDNNKPFDINKSDEHVDPMPEQLAKHEESGDLVQEQAGSHPVATVIGAASGGVAGAAIGRLIGGRAGAAIGAVAGAVAGGMTVMQQLKVLSIL